MRTQGELAALAGVTRPRVTLILNLLLLAPDIQEALLFLPPAEHGPEIITERALRYVLRTPLWRDQRARWPRFGMRSSVPHCERLGACRASMSS